MNSPWRKKTLTLCVSAALAQFAAGAAQADSALGVNTMLGNALNPNSLKTIPAKDPEVTDAVADQRTPTGKLLGWPNVIPTRTTTASGWSYNGEIEIGGMGAGGDTGSWWYNQYKDLPTGGVYLNNFYFQADQTKPGTGYFIEALGGGVGYQDQYEGVNFGRYNDWKVKLFYNETPHVFTTTYRNLWSGAGTENLTLNGLTPGGTLRTATAGAFPQTVQQNSSTATTRNIQAAIAATPYSELGLVRHAGGLTFDKWITNAWRFYFNYTNEHRDGTRPFGAVFGGGGGGGNIEIPESIDYDTQDYSGAFRYDDGVNNLNLVAQVSLFQNNASTLNFQNPLFIASQTLAPQLVNTGQIDLYPDNNWYNLRAEYARSMPEWYHSRLTATISLSKFKQNDDLLPWTPYSLQGVQVLGVDATNKWNTPASLTKQSADAEIDTQLFDLGFVMHPNDKFDVNAKFRYYSTDNKTDFVACNPLTGQFGRLYNNGTGINLAQPFGTNLAAVQTGYNGTNCDIDATRALNLSPNVANVNIRSTPYQYDKTNFELGGEYKISKGQTVNAKYLWEQYDRDYREVATSDENTLRLGYVNRAFSFGTLRVSGEYGERRGDDYIQTVYDQFEAPVLGPEPTQVGRNVATFLKYMGAWRKFDVADRDRLALDLRLDLIAMHDLDVGISGQYRDMSYPDSDYGRADSQRLGSATLDVNWQPSAKFSATGWYTHQTSSVKQYWMTPGGAGGGCVIGTTYFFYSDGTLSSTAAGAAATPLAGKTVVATQLVNSGNWQGVCNDTGPTSPLWPSQRSLAANTEDTNDAFGLAARYDFGYVRAELDGTYITGTTSQGYDWNQALVAPTGAVPTGGVALAAGQLFTLPSLYASLAGSGMPDQTYNQEIINFNLVFPVSKSFAVRLLYRYEQGTIDDWHYDGVSANPVPALANGAQAVYLDSGPQDYHVNTFGVLAQVTF